MIIPKIKSTNNMIYTLKRSNRKSIRLSINLESELIVNAPKFVSKGYIENLLEQKKSWIEKNLQKSQQKKSQLLKLDKGQKIPVFGEFLTIDFSLTKTTYILDQTLFLSQKGNLKQNLITFYKNTLSEYLSTKVPQIAKNMGLKYHKLSITSAKTRLGSCNSKKSLCFSFYNSTLPLWVIDYIIVHELSHTKELNHSNRFWKLVSDHYPNFREAKKYIKENFYIVL